MQGYAQSKTLRVIRAVRVSNSFEDITWISGAPTG